jgi:hypothetical protein
MTPTHADTARLAHRALRLRESGVDSEAKLKKLASESRNAPAVSANRMQEVARALRNGDQEKALKLASEQTISTVPALGGVAELTLAFTDPEDDRTPTDEALVQRLMSAESLGDIWKTWDEAVTANLEETLEDEDLGAWRASKERDARAHEEAVAEMLETGEFSVHPYFGHMRHTDGAANALYDVGRKGFADGDIDLLVATIKWVLVDGADYAANLATDQFLSSVASGGRVATSAALANKTTTAGVFDADDPTLSTVTGDPSEALVLVQSARTWPTPPSG